MGFRQVLFLIVSMVLVSSLSAAPIGLLYSKTTSPVSVSSLGDYSKSAKGSTFGLLYLLGFGNASVKDIAESNDITRVKYVDVTKTRLLLGLYQKDTYTVYGD